MKNDRIQGIIFNHKVPTSITHSKQNSARRQPADKRLSRRAVGLSKRIMEIVPAQLSHFKLHRNADNQTDRSRAFNTDELDDLLSRLKKS